MNEDSFAYALALARHKLRPAERRGSALPALGAAAFFAIAALTFAASAILAPANVVLPMARTGAP